MKLEEYLKIPALNGASCATMLSCPQKFNIKKVPTPAMRKGSLFHTSVLEPGELPHRYFVVPQEYRRGTKKWSLLEATAGDREIIKTQDLLQVFEMKQTLLRHPAVARLIEPGIECVEKSYVDSISDVRVKVRIDALTRDNVILELKTARTADPMRWENQIYEPGHDIKAAIAMGLAQADAFYWLLVEPEPPFCVSVIRASESLRNGEERLMKALGLYKKYKQQGHFPSYFEDGAAIL